MMRSRWLAVAGVLAAVFVFAACGSDDDDEGQQGAAAGTSGELSGAIDVWIMDPGSPALQGVIKGYATDFEAKNPGTEVNVQFVPWAQAHDKFVTAIAGGKVPDVAEMGTTWTPEFADQGAFEEVDKAASGDYVSSLVDAATLDDKVWGKPWYAGARGLIYRKDVLKKAGVEPPKTWDEVRSVSEAIKAKVPGIFPIGYTGLTEHMYLPTIWQAGGEIASQDGDTWKAALNSPEGAEAIDYYTSFYKDGLTPKDAIGWEEPDAQEAFINGDIAMLVAGGWGYNSIIDTKPELEKKIGTSLEPTGPSGEGTAFAGGSHLVVFKESENIETANAFVDFMLEADNVNEFTSEIGFLPGTVEGIESSGYLEDKARAPFAEQLLDHSKVYPPSPRWGALEGANIFDGEIQKVMKGQQTAAEAAKSLAEQMDEEFAG
jgi:N,N'-diacetylchitobiose transport system substrate-binding protein